MFCKNCGTEIEDGAVLCPNCLASKEKTEGTSLPLETNETPKKKKSKTPIIVTIIVAAVLVLFCVLPCIIGIIIAILGGGMSAVTAWFKVKTPEADFGPNNSIVEEFEDEESDEDFFANNEQEENQSDSENIFYNPNNTGITVGEVTVLPTFVKWETDGSLFVKCNIVNGRLYQVYDLKLTNFKIYNAYNQLVAEGDFGEFEGVSISSFTYVDAVELTFPSECVYSYGTDITSITYESTFEFKEETF